MLVGRDVFSIALDVLYSVDVNLRLIKRKEPIMCSDDIDSLGVSSLYSILCFAYIVLMG